MQYQLIALDLDGTLLDSHKNVPEDSVQAIRDVCAAGKTVVFNTGRAVPELTELIARLPEIGYAVFASGAGILDIRENRILEIQGIPAVLSHDILALAGTKDIMPQIVLKDLDVIQASHMERLAYYHMDVYRPMYEKAMTLVPDIYSFAESCPEPFLKINLYHADPMERIQTRAQLESGKLELHYSEISSLECSAKGVDKGSGLIRLCRILGILPEACIAVGDADNDISMFQSAGLGIAMGNASPYVKSAADLVVSDLDHGGCAVAIRMLL